MTTKSDDPLPIPLPLLSFGIPAYRMSGPTIQTWCGNYRYTTASNSDVLRPDDFKWLKGYLSANMGRFAGNNVTAIRELKGIMYKGEFLAECKNAMDEQKCLEEQQHFAALINTIQEEAEAVYGRRLVLSTAEYSFMQKKQEGHLHYDTDPMSPDWLNVVFALEPITAVTGGTRLMCPIPGQKDTQALDLYAPDSNRWYSFDGRIKHRVQGAKEKGDARKMLLLVFYTLGSEPESNVANNAPYQRILTQRRNERERNVASVSSDPRGVASISNDPTTLPKTLLKRLTRSSGPAAKRLMTTRSSGPASIDANGFDSD